ncbi:MAG: hypothetical protein IKY89_06410, partial [Alistipes sp.]|nr:hypothetical protein [Alistipes sp.]
IPSPWSALCHAERSRSISSLAMRYPRSRLSALRRFFVTLRMTHYSVIARAVRLVAISHY